MRSSTKKEGAEGWNRPCQIRNRANTTSERPATPYTPTRGRRTSYNLASGLEKHRKLSAALSRAYRGSLGYLWLGLYRNRPGNASERLMLASLTLEEEAQLAAPGTDGSDFTSYDPSSNPYTVYVLLHQFQRPSSFLVA